MRDSIGAINQGSKRNLMRESNISQDGKNVGFTGGIGGESIHVGENKCPAKGSKQKSYGQNSTTATPNYEGADRHFPKTCEGPIAHSDPVHLSKSPGSLRGWKKKARDVQRDSSAGVVNSVILGKRQAEEKGSFTMASKNKGRTMQRMGGSPYMLRDEMEEITNGSGSAPAVRRRLWYSPAHRNENP